MAQMLLKGALVALGRQALEGLGMLVEGPMPACRRARRFCLHEAAGQVAVCRAGNGRALPPAAMARSPVFLAGDAVYLVYSGGLVRRRIG